MLLLWAVASSCCLVLVPCAVTLVLLPYAVAQCCYLACAIQAQKLATELVTIVKQLIELNVKARKIKVCSFPYVPISLSCKDQSCF